MSQVAKNVAHDFGHAVEPLDFEVLLAPNHVRLQVKVLVNSVLLERPLHVEAFALGELRPKVSLPNVFRHLNHRLSFHLDLLSLEGIVLHEPVQWCLVLPRLRHLEHTLRVRFAFL